MRSLALLVTVLLAGCSAYRTPQIEVLGAALAERSDEAEVWRIELSLTNPNSEPFELREFDYRFSVDGQSVYLGRRAAEATLSARSEKRLQIPAVVRFDRCAAAGEGSLTGRSWQIDGSLLYVTPGEIAEMLLDTGARKPRVGFSGSGAFP